MICKFCNEEWLDSNICETCGYIMNNDVVYTIKDVKDGYETYSKMYSTKDPSISVKKYIYEFCNKYSLGCSDDVADLVLKINKLTKHTNRTKNRDGLILFCYHLLYNTQITELSKLTNIDVKYINKSGRTVLELVNMKRIDIKKATKLTNIDYHIQKLGAIPDVIKKQITILRTVVNKIEELKKLTPYSLDICCIYYILFINNINSNSNTVDLSIVTLNKFKNIILKYEEPLNEIGIFSVIQN